MSYSTPEGKVVRKLLDYANGIPNTIAHKVHGGTYSAGEPDLDIVCNGRAVKIEVKTPGTEAAIRKHVTPLQRAMLGRYERAGAIVGVVTSVVELRALLWDADLDGLDHDDVDETLAVIKRVRARLD